MDTKQVLYISIGWTKIHAFWLFILCPEVVWWDVTSPSNNKGFCVLTFSCWTSVDKQVVFLWIWIPNQQHFSFWWVFWHSIPFIIFWTFASELSSLWKMVMPSSKMKKWKLWKKIDSFFHTYFYLFTFSYSRLVGPCVSCRNVINNM